jgi:murein L,D-transpeptidase YcbB/YkuD
MNRVQNKYEYSALRMVATDSLGWYLGHIQPIDSLYNKLKSMLPTAKGSQRMRLLCNMERRRWRVEQRPDKRGKFVLVNVPAYHLWAISPDTVVDMRVVCGAQKTRTPLLTSHITHMVVNPEWVIPMSIIRNDIAHHAGDPAYFSRRGYYIAERKTNKRLSPEDITAGQLTSGALKVVQKSGPGNSLGRIMFRFNNKFNVFLHDTSSRGHFMSENRGVSHGCVRLHHPYDLAAFLLDNPDEWLLDKLRISMDMPPIYDKGREYMEREDRPEHPRLVSSLSVPSRVPIFITYYTIYPDPEGHLQTYNDVYGYDAAMGKVLNHFTE